LDHHFYRYEFAQVCFLHWISLDPKWVKDFDVEKKLKFSNLKYDFTIGVSDPTSSTSFVQSNTRKYPFMCDDNRQLFRDPNSQYMINNPKFQNIVVNTQFGLFLNDNAIAIGDHICDCWQSIIPNDN
jgi:hypothetical protein